MSGDPEEFLIVPEAAEELRMAKRTLDNHRWKGTGPKFRRHGGRIVYRRGDLLAWSEERAARMAAREKNGGEASGAFVSGERLCGSGAGMAQGERPETVLERQSERPNWPIHAEATDTAERPARNYPSA